MHSIHVQFAVCDGEKTTMNQKNAGAECWLFGSAAASPTGLAWFAVMMLMLQLSVVGCATTGLWLLVD
jgi:hypothetical protein